MSISDLRSDEPTKSVLDLPNFPTPGPSVKSWIRLLHLFRPHLKVNSLNQTDCLNKPHLFNLIYGSYLAVSELVLNIKYRDVLCGCASLSTSLVPNIILSRCSSYTGWGGTVQDLNDSRLTFVIPDTNIENH